MRVTQRNTPKNASDLVEKDIVDIAGVKYRVFENVPNTLSAHKRNITLTTVSSSPDEFVDRVFMVVPSHMPMTTYKEQ